MNEQFIKQILSTLNREAFTSFIFELWKLEDYKSDLKYQKIKSIGTEMFEQHYWDKSNEIGVYENQGFNVIIPFFSPIELFSKVDEKAVWDTELIKKLKKYKRRISRRESSWQYSLDGMYHMPLISFASNFEGLNQDFYFDNLIPKFANLVDKIGLEAEIAVGGCDSFLELNPENTITAFKNFINKEEKQFSISISGDKFELGYFKYDKFLTNGLLRNSKYPYEPVYINNHDKSEIIKEFEHLINKRVPETKLEKFIAQHYKIIFGEKYDRIETQLWLRFPELDISNKNRRLDIFLRNSIERDWELIELKNSKKLTRTYRDIPTFTCEIQNAIQQLKAYEKLLAQSKVKNKFAREGIEYFSPELKLVVGRKPDISIEQWRFLKSTNENNLKIITFDDLLESMKIRYNLQINNER